jgi:hypothetical protein
MPEALKFGILCNSLVFQQWQAEIITSLIAHGHKPSLLILNAENNTTASKTNRLKQYPWEHLFYRIQQRFCFKPQMKQETDLSKDLQHVPVLTCKTRNVNFSEYFFDDDVNFIQDQHLDFILRFGFNIMRGKVLHTAKYGIWSYHHGDEQKYRGGPPCFWEIFLNDPVTGSVLQKLNEKLDAGVILRKAWFGTIMHSYTENLDRVYRGSVPWVLQVCNDIQNGNADYFDKPGSTTRAKLYRAPGNTQMLRFSFKLILNRFKYHIKEIFLSEKWNSGIIEASVNKVAFNWEAYHGKIRWLPEPIRSTYVADPFIYNIGDEYRLLFEKYDYRRLQGHIEQLPLNDIQQKSATAVLKDGSHFSFPYAFEHDMEIYCVPENAASGKTSLYRLDCSEKKLEFVATILDRPLIDPTIFRWENLWWMLGTLPDYPSESLHIWYSQELTGPFFPHPNNPVKIDVRSSRPAGKPFISGGILYRPAQNCSKTYGGNIVINQVITLTTKEFMEQPVVELYPHKHWKYSKGMHTISGADEFTVIDAKRLEFIPMATINKLKRKFRIKTNKA